MTAYGPLRQPILTDRAYFIYLGQAILRGDEIYSTTFFGYPPLGPLLLATSMWIGELFGVPTYLAPRLLPAPVFALCVVLVYFVTRRATGSDWAGLLAGIVLASISHLGSLSTSNLEPKVLAILFGLAASSACQRQRWLAAGAFCGLGVACWQPAIFAAASSLAVLLWCAGGRRLRSVAAFVAGGLLGGLPPLAYPLLTGTWWDFWQRAFEIPLAGQLPNVGGSPTLWLAVGFVHYRNELAFFLLAALGLVLFASGSAREVVRTGGIPPGLDSWLGPATGGVPLLTVLWTAFNAIEFQGPPDMLPILPFVAFWSAWCAHALATALTSGKSRRSGRSRSPRSISKPIVAAILIAAAGYGIGDAFLHRPFITLQEEQALVREIVGAAGPDDVLTTFEAPEVYVLTGRQSPTRLLSLNSYFMDFSSLIGIQRCSDVQRALGMPKVVVIKSHPWQSSCVGLVAARLRERGYRVSEYALLENRHQSYVPDESLAARLEWRVYRRPDP